MEQPAPHRVASLADQTQPAARTEKTVHAPHLNLLSVLAWGTRADWFPLIDARSISIVFGRLLFFGRFLLP